MSVPPIRSRSRLRRHSSGWSPRSPATCRRCGPRAWNRSSHCGMSRGRRAASDSLPARGAADERATKFAPVLLVQLYFVLLRSGFDSFPGGVAFRLGHPFDLLEAGDCVAHVSRVMDGFFTFLGESEVLVRDMIAAGFGDLGHTS